MKTEPDLTSRIAALYREVDALAQSAAQSATAERISRSRLGLLRRTGRAFQQAESTTQWTQLLCDAAASLCSACAFFRIEEGLLVAEGFRGPEPMPAPFPLTLAQAPAFRQVAETVEPVAALKTNSEFGPAAAALWPDSGARKAHLFPLAPHGKPAGILYAEADALDADSLELLLSLAAASIEMRRAALPQSVAQTAPGLIAIAASSPAAAPEKKLSLDLIRARRFSRARVASWILAHPHAIARGRAEKNIYAHLRHPIDSARVEYLRNFENPPFTNQLDLEILERLAWNDSSLLGPAFFSPPPG